MFEAHLITCYCHKKKIYFFSVYAKTLSKRAAFSLVLGTLENTDVFNTSDQIFLVFNSKKFISSIHPIIYSHLFSPKQIYLIKLKNRREINRSRVLSSYCYVNINVMKEDTK